MKTDEVINILDKVVKLLSLLPGKDISSTLDEMILMAQERDKKNGIKQKAETKLGGIEKQSKIISDLSIKLPSMSISDVEKELNNTDVFKTNKDIMGFAKSLGLTVSTRQNRDNIIHTIVKHIERSRIDKTISERSR